MLVDQVTSLMTITAMLQIPDITHSSPPPTSLFRRAKAFFSYNLSAIFITVSEISSCFYLSIPADIPISFDILIPFIHACIAFLLFLFICLV